MDQRLGYLKEEFLGLELQWFNCHTVLANDKRDLGIRHLEELLEKYNEASNEGTKNRIKKEIQSLEIPYVDRKRLDGNIQVQWNVTRFNEKGNTELPNGKKVGLAEFKTIVVDAPREVSDIVFIDTLKMKKAESVLNVKAQPTTQHSTIEELILRSKESITEAMNLEKNLGPRLKDLVEMQTPSATVLSSCERAFDSLNRLVIKFCNDAIGVLSNAPDSRISVRVCVNAENLYGKNLVYKRPDLGKEWGKNILKGLVSGLSESGSEVAQLKIEDLPENKSLRPMSNTDYQTHFLGLAM